MTEPKPPVRWAIKFPVSARREYDVLTREHTMRFTASDGSELAVVLSREQMHALFTNQSPSAAEVVRDLYERGHVEVEVFERELDRQIRLGHRV